jgi:galactose mutarotase-like enzyme
LPGGQFAGECQLKTPAETIQGASSDSPLDDLDSAISPWKVGPAVGWENQGAFDQGSRTHWSDSTGFAFRLYTDPAMNTIHSNSITVVVSPKGAELQSIKGPGGIEYLWQGDPAYWPRRSPLLFPIVGALPGGTYTHKGVAYKLGNHGFVRDLEFALAQSGPDWLRYELAADAHSLAVYPFRFRLAVNYKAAENSLRVGWEVANEDSATMYFSIGAHPAFRAPLATGEQREDYELIFEKKETVDRHILNSDNVRAGETEPVLVGQDRLGLSPTLFEKGAIVLDSHLSRRLTLRSRISGCQVEVSFAGFPQLGIWSPKGDVPFVCIEPWYGIMPLAGSAQELARKAGCLSLEPGKTFVTEYRITVG